MYFVDHLFILLLFVVQPLHGAMAYRRYIRKIEAGEPSDRIRLYLETAVLEWVALAVLGAVWIYLGRPFADIGFVPAGGDGFWIGTALLVPVCGYLVYTWQAARKMDADSCARQVESVGDLIHFLPQDKEDYRVFVGVSITAGIVEEVIYRGFVFWYLAQFMPIWAVVVVASIAFGLGHSYQGTSGILRVTLIGLAFGGFYVLTGSIWLPMIAHALLDIIQGALLVEIYRGAKAPRCPPSTTLDATQ